MKRALSEFATSSRPGEAALPPARDGMRLRLLAVLLAASLPIVVFAVVMAALFEQQQRGSVTDAVRLASAAAARSIDDRIGAVRYGLEAFATSEAIGPGAGDKFEEQAKRALELRPDWDALRLTEPDGSSRTVLRDGARLAADAGPDIEAALRYGEPSVSDVLIDPQRVQEPLVAVTVPVTSPVGTVSVLTAYLRAWAVNRAVRSQGISPDWIIAVLDPEGRIVARTGSPDPLDPAVGVPPTDSTVLESLRRGESAFFARAHDGHQVYVSAVVSAATGWTVLLGVPSALVEQPIRNTRFAVGGGVVLALLLAGVFGSLLSRAYAKRQQAERSLIAREAAGAAERRAASVLGAMSDAVIEVDGRGRIVYLNEQARRQIAGDDTVPGSLLAEILPEAGGERFTQELRRAADGHVVAEFEQYHARSARWYLVRIFPSLDGGAAIYFQDITARKGSEQALAESHALLERVFEASADPIFVKGRDGRYLMANSATAAWMGTERPALIGRKDAAFFPADVTARIEEDDRRVIEGEADFLLDREFEGPVGGEKRQLLVTKYPLRDRAGNIAGLVGMLKDVTERKRVEERLRASQRLEAVGRLTGGVAHDFNNLLLVVVGNLDLLAGDPAVPPAARKIAEDALAAALRGSDLTKRLLSFARLQPLKPTTIDLNRQLERIVPLLRRTLGEAIRVEVRPGSGLWPVLVDASQIDDAVINLAINARDAMPDGGQLTLETMNARLDAAYAAANPEAAPGDYVALTVTDTGVGMPPEVLARALEPFFTTKEFGRGSGLGLAQIYGFVRQSNGHLKLSSEVGQGTTVCLYLPRAPGGRDEPDGQRAATAAPVGGRETILVVDDNPHVRDTVARALAGLGYGVAEAGSGPEALRVLAQRPEIEMLFSDVVMPEGMNGFELARRARALRPGLPVLLSSGYADPAVQEAVADRPVPLIVKPYRIADLAASIRKVLGDAGSGGG